MLFMIDVYGNDYARHIGYENSRSLDVHVTGMFWGIDVSAGGTHRLCALSDPPMRSVQCPAIVAAAGSVWVTGGTDHGRALVEVNRYDIAENKWYIPTTELPHPLSSHSLTCIDAQQTSLYPAAAGRIEAIQRKQRKQMKQRKQRKQRKHRTHRTQRAQSKQEQASAPRVADSAPRDAKQTILAAPAAAAAAAAAAAGTDSGGGEEEEGFRPISIVRSEVIRGAIAILVGGVIGDEEDEMVESKTSGACYAMMWNGRDDPVARAAEKDKVNWVPLPPLKYARAGHSAFLLDNKLVVVGGGGDAVEDVAGVMMSRHFHHPEMLDLAAIEAGWQPSLVCPTPGSTTGRFADQWLHINGRTRQVNSHYSNECWPSFTSLPFCC
jgi:hypothetical protein